MIEKKGPKPPPPVTQLGRLSVFYSLCPCLPTPGLFSFSIEQALATPDSMGQMQSAPCFINKVLLEYSHVHSCAYYLYLLLHGYRKAEEL